MLRIKTSDIKCLNLPHLLFIVWIRSRATQFLERFRPIDDLIQEDG